MQTSKLIAVFFSCIILFTGCRGPGAETMPKWEAFSCMLSDDTYLLRYTVSPDSATMTVLAPETIAGLVVQWRGTDCRILYEAAEPYISIPVTAAVLGGFADLPEVFRQSMAGGKNGVPQTVSIRHPGSETEKVYAVTEFVPAE